MRQHAPRPVPNRRPPPGVAFALSLLAATALVVVALSAPASSLVSSRLYSILSAAHGVLALTYLLASTIGVYLAWRLLHGDDVEWSHLAAICAACAVLSLLTVVLGNWLYVGYRAPRPDSPRAWLLANNPHAHSTFFEFKELVSLFTLPLAVSVSFIVWRGGRLVLEDRVLRVTAAVLLLLNAFYVLMCFGLGAAVTRIRML